jgi:hypothetical protein
VVRVRGHQNPMRIRPCIGCADLCALSRHLVTQNCLPCIGHQADVTGLGEQDSFES